MKDTDAADKGHGETVATETLVDCGRASDLTRGIPLQLLFELGWPPNNKMFLV
jgi:hypothetical protein